MLVCYRLPTWQREVRAYFTTTRAAMMHGAWLSRNGYLVTYRTCDMG